LPGEYESKALLSGLGPGITDVGIRYFSPEKDGFRW